MNKLIVVLGVALIAGSLYYLNRENQFSQQEELREIFNGWKNENNKKYGSQEEQYRFAVFEQNYFEIQAHNNDESQTYKMGLNQFSDLTDEEFASIYLTEMEDDSEEEIEEVSYSDVIPNGSSDWSGKVKVKNQGHCGSCWAFSAVGAVESFHSIKNGKDYDLAEQQLVDCDTASHGCNGGYKDRAMTYVQKNGLTNQGSYPYTARDGTCKQTGGSVKINSVKKITSSASSVQSALNSHPVAVSVNASNWSKYSSGVFSDCSNTSTNHAVLAVGYDASGNWKIKNSWGSSWGEKGFIRLAPGNTCAVLNKPYQAF